MLELIKIKNAFIKAHIRCSEWSNLDNLKKYRSAAFVEEISNMFQHDYKEFKVLSQKVKSDFSGKSPLLTVPL